MLSCFIQCQRSPLDDDDTYFRKRPRFVANIARLSGAWGTEHVNRIASLAEHLKRPQNQLLLAARFSSWRNETGLQQRRLDPHIEGTARPGTRVVVADAGLFH